MAIERLSNLDSFADLLDRLIIEINKISMLEQLKAQEHEKEAPRLDRIAHWDLLSRRAVNLRAELKNRINKELANILREGTYQVLPEAKTFPPRPFSEVLADRCHDIGNTFLREEMAQQLIRELSDPYQGA